MNDGRRRAYVSWSAAIQRCTNEKSHAWRRYGGRGIAVCAQWLESFEAFFANMGARPEGRSLDRIDVNGNYEPGNCRWATRAEQAVNKRPGRSAASPRVYGPKRTVGQPPKYGKAMVVRKELKLTEADAAEIEAAVPAGFSRSRWVVEAALERARNQRPR